MYQSCVAEKTLFCDIVCSSSGTSILVRTYIRRTHTYLYWSYPYVLYIYMYLYVLVSIRALVVRGCSGIGAP
eukprot:SAG11_NODE_24322_length_372_cov_0.554348_1_plen_71_part_10